MYNVLDWQKYCDIAREMVGEGTLLLENKEGTLPFVKGTKLSVFGRIQFNYYKSGTGSGGMVNVSPVTCITDALLDSGLVEVNKELIEEYQKWIQMHPIQEGCGWGTEPWSQEEMPLDDDTVQRAAEFSSSALVIIGRTGGEDQDCKNEEGSYLFSKTEQEMILTVRKSFAKVTIVLNVGNIMDPLFLDIVKADAVVYAWHGGMLGGYGVADVLTGKVNPSGHLTDTIAYRLEDYPAHNYFGNRVRNYYAEDIFVGYRYFETFAEEKVRYPFGYGLSYTNFYMRGEGKVTKEGFDFRVNVRNQGNVAGKEVVQIYLSAPQGKLGKASRVLVAFAKTKLLLPDEAQELRLFVKMAQMGSYDETGRTGFTSAWVVEDGCYTFFLGNNVRDSLEVFSWNCAETLLLRQCEEAIAPVLPFKRMAAAKNTGGKPRLVMEDTPLRKTDMQARMQARMPIEIPRTGDRGLTLEDVMLNNCDMDTFIAQLTDEELACIIRGEGMGSPRVTPGTAAAFGGVSDLLNSRKIPAGCCADGPSGMRLDTGVHAFSLPIGTLLASSFNVDLVEQLYTQTGIEMLKNKVDVLLAPGMNIHRYPLNGRNFEYFSEDPFVTGSMAIAVLKGLHHSGVTGSLKHYCGNNQETGRLEIDSCISERALREIYLKGFEMAVQDAHATAVMTTYGSLNGQWTAGCYDLNTTVLRNEWGFDGFVMTDWFADISDGTQPKSKNNFAAMVRAQNDVYMVCPDGSVNSMDDNTIASLQNGTLPLSMLQQSAKNIAGFLLSTPAMKRMCGEETKITVLNQPKEDANDDEFNVTYYSIEDEFVLPLDEVNTFKGSSYSFAMIFENLGNYRVTLTAKSDMGEVAQMSVTLSFTSIPIGQFTWVGTGGEWVSKETTMPVETRYMVYKLYFAQSGLKLRDICISRIKD